MTSIKSDKLHIPIRRLLCCLLCTVLLLQFFTSAQPVSAAVTIPTHESLYSQISTINQRALAYDKTYYGMTASNGYTAFTSLCAHYVHIQLMLLGINTRYVGGNGKDEYDNYKDLNYSGGGRRIHAYPATNWSIYDALADISRQSRISTGILCGYEYTSSSAGKKYGHVMLIHGIIDGNVYFTDNFATKFGDKSYATGDPIVCTVAEFAAFYGRPSVFGFEGIIWFEDEQLTAAVGGKTLPPDNPGTSDTPSTGSKTPGQYVVTYSGGLRIRKSYTTSSDTLEIIPGNSTVIVTEVKNNWGHVYTNVGGTYYDGWISLDYARREADLPAIAAEKYSNGKIIAREWFNTLPEALRDSSSSDKYVLYANTTLTEDVTLGSGKTLEAASYTISTSAKARLLIRGGKVTSKIKQTAVSSDPFVSTSYSSSTYTYSCSASLSVTDAGLSITNGASVKLIGSLTVPSGISGLRYSLVSSDFTGKKKEFTTSKLSGTRLELVSDALPADTLGQKLHIKVSVSCESYGKTYSIESNEIEFCPSEYVSSIYGKNTQLDSLLADMLNFSSSVQAMKGVNSAEFTNKVLPENARNLSYSDTEMPEAIDAPVTNDTCKVNIESVTLNLDAGAQLNFRVDGSTVGTKLMVFSYSTYQKLLRQYGASNVGKHMTEENADEILTADANGNFVFSSPSAKQFADTYYFRICRTASGVTTYDSAFAYSITEYCRRAVTTTDNQNIINLCRSLCAFSASARDYFGYEINQGS